MDTKVKVFVGIVLVSAIFIGKAISMAGGPNDEAQIQDALAASIEASREGRAGGVMDKLSTKFRINNEIPASFRQIAQFIKDAKPDITVAPATPVVSGDEAKMKTSVDFRMKMGDSESKQKFDDVTLIFRKEAAREWVVIPSHKWRLAEVEAGSFNAAEMAQ
ncbi:MAG: hypothetical protein ACOYON_14800 [Fimbriimonas sp.]